MSLVRTPRTIDIDGHPVRENLVVTPGGRVLTWHWYRINGHTLVGDAEAKLRLAGDRLLGQADESAVVVLATPADHDEDAARARLEAFLADHSSEIERAVETPAESIPR